MAKTVVVNQYNGGLAQDVRERSSNTFFEAKNFDTISSSYTISPHPETEAETRTTGDITDNLVTDIARDTSGYIYALGRTSSGTPTGNTFLIKSSGTNIASTYDVHASSGVGNAYRPNSLVQHYNGFYYIDSNHALKKLTFPTTFSTAGTILMSSNWSNELIPRPVVHPLKKYLYAAVGQYFARVTDAGVYADLSSMTLPSNSYVSSLAPHNSYLAVAAAPSFTGGRSTMYLWDMAEDRTFNDSIDWGEGSLLIAEDIGGTLVGVSISDASYTNVSTYTSTQKKKLTIRYLSGNQSIILKEYDVASNFNLKNFKATVNGRMYFGGDNDDSLYVIYKNENGNLVVSRDRYMANGTVVTNLRGFNVIGDYLFIGYDTASTTGNFYRTKVSPVYPYDSYMVTTINPNMEIGDRTKRKQLKAVSVAKAGTNGTVYLQYSYDGGVNFYTVGSAFTSLVNKMTNQYDNSPFEQGYEYQFKILSEGGAEVTELKYSYEVIEELI